MSTHILPALVEVLTQNTGSQDGLGYEYLRARVRIGEREVEAVAKVWFDELYGFAPDSAEVSVGGVVRTFEPTRPEGGEDAMQSLLKDWWLSGLLTRVGPSSPLTRD